MNMTVGEIAKLLNAVVEGDQGLEITGPGKIEDGCDGQLCFYANAKYEDHIYSTKCTALLLQTDYILTKPIPQAIIRVPNVYEAIGFLLTKFTSKVDDPIGISTLASIDPTASIGKSSTLGHYSIIGRDTKIGDNTTIHGQVFIANDCTIGNNCLIYPGVKLYHGTKVGDNCIIHSNAVIGSDGFGFSQSTAGVYNKIPQTGIVVIENDVEIGSCTVIDRATMGETIIKKGVKLDNLIQIAHNASIGENTAIAAQTGVSGSTKIGKNCIVGGQVGFVGHIEVADGSMFQAKTGVASSIKKPNNKYYGYPAIGYQDYLKSYIYFKKLPEIVGKIESLEQELDILRSSIKKD